MTQRWALILIKAILTILVGYALAYPLLHPPLTGGIWGELAILGLAGSTLVAAVFLLLVCCYCRDLQHSLTLVAPASRAAAPGSVWLMLLIPYNFVEDFFIIANVSRSLQAEASSNPALRSFKHFGMATGLGWCSAQILSLIPNDLGSLAGLLALLLWIAHWRLIRRLNRALAAERAKPSPI